MYDQLRICCPTRDTFAVRVYEDPVRGPLPTEQTAAPSWVCVVPTRSSVLLPRDVTHSAACHIDLHISAALYVEF